MHIPILDKFPVDVTILQKTGSGIMSTEDKARYIVEGSIGRYELKSAGTIFKPVGYESMIPQENGKSRLFLYEYQRGLYVPIDAANLEVIYERDRSGNVVMETTKVMCSMGHKFGTPLKKKVKRGLRREETEIEVCPFCLSEKLSDIAKEDQETRPKIQGMVNLKCIEEDVAFWGQMRRWESEERHKDSSWWKENVHFIMFAMTWILLIILAQIFMTAVADTGHDMINAMQEFMRSGLPPG